jgi:hypothetical protein
MEDRSSNLLFLLVGIRSPWSALVSSGIGVSSSSECVEQWSWVFPVPASVWWVLLVLLGARSQLVAIQSDSNSLVKKGAP